MNYKFDPDKSASLILGDMAIKRIKQVDLADEVGISKILFNMFLNRKLNLLPEQLENVLDALGIRKQAEKLSGLNDEKQSI